MAKIGNLNLTTLVFNASGVHCTTASELLDLQNNKELGAVISKTCTLEPRIGNPEPRLWSDGTNSLNSTGLANLGIDFYISQVIVGKPYIVSIAGIGGDDEYLALLDKIYNCENVNGVEINVSCPNIIGKPQLGYDFDRLNNLLSRISQHLITCTGTGTGTGTGTSTCTGTDTGKTIGLKLPPYMDANHFETVAKIINQNEWIHFITCCNSIANCYIEENGKPVIAPNDSLGGLGGEAIRPLAMGNVKIFRKLLNPRVSIIGCGGVSEWLHVEQYIKLGASAVQIGTHLLTTF